MKKVKKSFKLLSFILVCILVVSTTSNAGQMAEPELVETFVINEFEHINELKSMSDDMLIEEGFTEIEIAELRELDLEELMVERIKSSSKTELRQMGYSNRDIDIIEDLDLDNLDSKQLYALSSTLTLKVYKAKSGASNSRSYLNLEIEWDWDIMPVFTNTDIIACSWSKGYSSQSSSHNAVDFVHFGERRVKRFYIDDKLPGSGCSFKVPLVHPEYSNFVGRSGCVYLDLYDNSYISNAEVLIKYGHSTVKGNVKVSFPEVLSIEFSKGAKTTKIWYDYDEYKNR